MSVVAAIVAAAAAAARRCTPILMMQVHSSAGYERQTIEEVCPSNAFHKSIPMSRGFLFKESARVR